MNDILAPLTDDETATLLIAAEGQSMIPMGRWEGPVLRLAQLGYLKAQDRSNYVITAAGSEAARAQNADIDRALMSMVGKRGTVNLVSGEAQTIEDVRQIEAQAQIRQVPQISSRPLAQKDALTSLEHQLDAMTRLCDAGMKPSADIDEAFKLIREAIGIAKHCLALARIQRTMVGGGGYPD